MGIEIDRYKEKWISIGSYRDSWKGLGTGKKLRSRYI